jgi:hypothetical protein
VFPSFGVLVIFFVTVKCGFLSSVGTGSVSSSFSISLAVAVILFFKSFFPISLSFIMYSYFTSALFPGAKFFIVECSPSTKFAPSN